MKMTKKVLSILLSLMLVLGTVAAGGIGALADGESVANYGTPRGSYICQYKLGDTYGDHWSGSYILIEYLNYTLTLGRVNPNPDPSTMRPYEPTDPDSMEKGYILFPAMCDDPYGYDIEVSWVNGGYNYDDEVIFDLSFPDGSNLHVEKPVTGCLGTYHVNTTPGESTDYEVFKVAAEDSMLDGWTGGAIEIYQEGRSEPFTRVVNNDGEARTENDILLPRGYSYRFDWVYDRNNSECSVEVTDNNGLTYSAVDPINGPLWAFDVPYEIGDAANLRAFADNVNNRDRAGFDAVLTADIDLVDEPFTPIGTYEHPYEGTFDGDGHIITGLTYNSSADYAGLFGYVGSKTEGGVTTKGTVKNVGLVGGAITGRNCVGGVVGYNNGGSITNCYNTGDVSGNNYVGGVVGENEKGTVTSCYNTGAVSGADYVGGVAGYNCENSSIENCYNMGDVTGTGDSVGGVAGENYSDSTVENCYNTGAVTGNNFVGGVTGDNAGGSSVENCYNTSAVTGNNYIGGVAGYNFDNSSVENCYNTGDVTGTGDSVGGVAGYNFENSSIENCYNTGDVSGNDYVGGVVGYNDSSSTISNCYNTGDVTGNYSVGGVAGENYSDSTVENCYNTGNVTGNYSVGGVAGENCYNNSSVENCYYDSDRAPGIYAIGYESSATHTNVEGLTTVQMTGANALDNMVFEYGDGEASPWQTKADGADVSGKYFLFYPHLKGFAYDRTSATEDWPAKVEITVGLSDGNSCTYDGEEHGVYVTVGDTSVPEGGDVTYSQYKYFDEDNRWEWKEILDSPTDPGNYRMTARDGDKVIETKYFTILEQATDYTVSYYKKTGEDWSTDTVTPVDAGEYKAVVTFTDTGHDQIEKEFTINPKSLTGAIVTLSQDTAEYTGGEIMPDVTVKDGSTVLIKDTDYTIGYSNNVNASQSAKVTVTGIGNYKDSVEKTFVITPASVKLTANSRNTDVYDGTEKTISGFTSSVEGLTFEGVTASGSGTQAGSYDVTFSGVTIGETKDSSGNYVVTATENGTLTINPAAPGTSAAAEDIDYGQTAVVTFTAPADAEGKVTFTLDEAESGVTKDIENGQAVCEFENLTIGSHKVECVYTGDGNYEPGETKTAGFEVKSVDCPLTINYVYAQGGEAHESYTDNVAIFNSYSVTSPEITGYTPNPATVEGTMGDEDKDGKTVIVTYTANTYTATLLVDGAEYEKIPFTYGQKSIQLPEVPEKEGHTGSWESYSLGAGDITINAIYKPVEYTVTYIFDGEVLSEMSIPYGEAVSSPRIPSKDYYEFTGWDAEIPEKMPANNLTFTAVLKPIEYTATFVDENGETVAEVPYTVESGSIEAPAVPVKEGCNGEWEDYELTPGGITVKPVYTPADICPLDNEYHGDNFWGRLVKFFHTVIWKAFNLVGINIYLKIW